MVIGQKPGNAAAVRALAHSFSLSIGASSEDLAQVFDQQQNERRAELQLHAEQIGQQAEQIKIINDQT